MAPNPPTHLCPACGQFGRSCPLDPAGPVPRCVEFRPLDLASLHAEQARLADRDWRAMQASCARELEARAAIERMAARMEGRR